MNVLLDWGHADQFKEVAWRQVYDTLHLVPRMFGIWTCKQVMGIAGTNYNPSCDFCLETCGHVLFCEEEGRVNALHKTIRSLESLIQTQC